MSIDKKEAAEAIGTFLKEEFIGVAKAMFAPVVGLVKGHPISYTVQAHKELDETFNRNYDRVVAAFTQPK